MREDRFSSRRAGAASLTRAREVMKSTRRSSALGGRFHRPCLLGLKSRVVFGFPRVAKIDLIRIGVGGAVGIIAIWRAIWRVLWCALRRANGVAEIDSQRGQCPATLSGGVWSIVDRSTIRQLADATADGRRPTER